MQTVTSADGTRIAYDRHGEGSPLILLHGTSADRHSFRPLIPRLADEHTLIVPDRRGRGDSEDGSAYSLDREVEDLRALVGAVDGTPSVFGHSFGGLVTLAAAPDLAIERLVLYEPAVLVGDHQNTDLADRLEERFDAGDRRDVLRLFIEEAGGVPDATALPWWPEDAPFDRAETIVRESRAVEDYRLPVDPSIDGPALLLTGERGPEPLRDAIVTVEDRLPDAQLTEFEGVGHMGPESAAHRVGDTVTSFLG
ncbi:alpha/beta hydrolase fold protein [Halorhabdus utahensis DSM 12940]|uniref:Alpha/beta hydrolase fold protein n=1 Tax=Halorhabdus utahensis (strain DSM 12940 / JCM 11049 / AX-2) TaxID=519442 RepID=C7NUT6_HALUD|nr:alpha/beta hydrolase [Halorhabdus utahensis]ACV11099.1 alpha/beta hydrolase fold protein [Halorhabdus utahensis DSM 12940]